MQNQNLLSDHIYYNIYWVEQHRAYIKRMRKGKAEVKQVRSDG